MIKQLFTVVKLIAGALIATRDDTVLVVVDMQPGFLPDGGDPGSPAAKRALLGVAREIKRAIRRGMPIVVVEYRRHAGTHPQLMQLLKGYARYRIAKKGQMDGSKGVLHACREMGLRQPPAFRVCGTYTHYCVEETVLGLSRKRRRSVVEVVRSACTDPSGNNWELFAPAFTRTNIALV
jgi:nicotinamidase-related amidase